MRDGMIACATLTSTRNQQLHTVLPFRRSHTKNSQRPFNKTPPAIYTKCNAKGQTCFRPRLLILRRILLTRHQLRWIIRNAVLLIARNIKYR